MREEIVQLILDRLEQERDTLRAQFSASAVAVGVRYCVVDDLLHEPLARRINESFPEVAKMRLMDSFRERKYTSKKFDEFDPLLGDVTFAFQDSRVVQAAEAFTGIREEVPDSSLYAGGLSAMARGHFLGPHIDNSHEALRNFYRTLSLLYYVTPDWSMECEGNLQLWNREVARHETIVSRFKRLVIMETTPTSWHAVSEVKVDALRRRVSNYYFSPRSPTGAEYFNVTTFSARPEQKALRVLSCIDNKLRQAIPIVAPSGLAKSDVHQDPDK